MKAIVSVIAVLSLAGGAFAQSPQVYTPPADNPTAPTFVNAQVVRVDTSGRTITFRSGSGDTVLTVEGEALGGLAGLHAGDQVMLGYRVDTRDGRSTRIVTNIRPVVPAVAARPGPSRATTIVERTAGVVTQPAASAPGGMPLPSNQAGAPAVLQPVPNVGPPTTPTLNVALPPANAGSSADAATAAQAEAIRAQGERDLQAAASVLTLKANEIDGLWFGFKDLCLGGTTPAGASTSTGREWFILLGGSAISQPADDACRQRQADLARAAQQFQQQLSIATDSARKADVLPGTMREILQRNRLDR